MGFCGWLNYVLTLSMSVTLVCSMAIFTFGLMVRFSLDWLIEVYFDPGVKNLEVSKLVSSKQESIVPTREDIPDDLYLGNWSRTLGTMIILLATAMASYSLFGIAASISRKTALLIALACIVTITLICQFLLLIAVVDLTSWLHTNAQEQAYSELRRHFEVGPKVSNAVTYAMNALMMMTKCCGVYGPADFHGMEMTFKYTDPDTGEKVMFDPPYAPACCSEDILRKGFKETVECAKNGELTSINNRGCYIVMYNYVVTNWAGLITSLFAFIMLWEMLQVILALTVIFRPKIREKEAIKAAMAATGMTRRQLLRSLDADEEILAVEPADEKAKTVVIKRVFQPYSKISSYVSTEIDRVKSTEIW